MVVDRKTGRKSVVQEEIVDFDGKFSKETLPSIYYALSNGMPVVEQEKGTERFSVRLSNVSQNRVLYLGNLTLDRLRLVHEMKSFVDKKMGLDIHSNENLTI